MFILKFVFSHSDANLLGWSYVSNEMSNVESVETANVPEYSATTVYDTVTLCYSRD